MLSILSCVCFCDYCSFVFRECGISTFGLFSQDCLSNVGILWFSITFRIICSGSVKNVMGIYLFWTALGLRCCVWAFSICGERVAALRCGARASYCGGFSCCRAWALGTWASVVVACGLSSCGLRALEYRLSSCGARAWLLRGMWDLPGPGLEPVSPALAGGFLTTVPPGKSLMQCFNLLSYIKCP